MTISLDLAKEKIKERVDVANVLEKLGIEARQFGSELRAPCPLHNGDGLNWSFSLESGRWTCWSHGCGSDRGVPRDIFLLVQMMKNISFPDAVRYLGGLVGFAGEDFEYSKVDDDQYKVAKWLKKQREMRRIGNEQVDESILNTFDKEPHPYILGRGFTPDTIREFEMAYAPSGEFAGRIVLPIRNEEGVLVGISGRLATDDPQEIAAKGKYRNLADFSSGAVLFNLHRAKTFVEAYGVMVLVEGQLDAAKAHQNGLWNVCATMGTAILPEQIDLVVKYTSRVYLAYDVDENGAGQKGTWRIYERLKPYCDVRIMELPMGRDVEKLTAEELWHIYENTISPLEFRLKYGRWLSQ